MSATLETTFSIVSDYIDIVDTAVATVSRRLPAHVAREDLASVGKIALISALDQVQGTSDEIRSYCFVRVRGAILDELRRLDPLSRRHRDLLNRVTRVQNELNSRLGRAPTHAEIATAAQISVGDVIKAVTVATETASPSEAEWVEVADLDTPSPVDLAESDDLKVSLRSAFARLSSVQAVVLHRYYFEEATLETIASDLDLSKERVRQIRNAAEAKLRGDFVVLALWQSLLSSR